MAYALDSEWATAPETTPGTPPVDAATWVTNGTRHRHLAESVSMEGVVPADVEDLRSQTNILDHELRVEGLRNGSYPVQVYGTGTGVETSSGTQVTQTALSTLLENSLGGVDLSNSTVLSGGGHTTTTITVTADTNFAVGGHIAWVHPTTGLRYVRRLLVNNGGANWDLDEALPATPNDTEVIDGAITHYVDSDVLCDSAQSGRQFSTWVRKGSDDNQIWEFTGCKLQINSIELPRDGLPTISFDCHYANVTLPNETPPVPAWTATPDGFAPVVTGRRQSLHVQDYASTVSTSLGNNGMEISFGLPITRDEIDTTAQDGMQATNKYYLGKGETTMTFSLDFDTAYFADWAAGTYKNFRYSNTPAAAGQGFCVSMPRSEVIRSPNRSVSGEISKQTVTLKAHRDTTTIGTTALARSPVCVVLF